MPMCNNKEKKLPRGLRNNNPGNIRQSSTKYLGEVQPSQDSAFKQFQSIDYGYRAMFVLIEHYYRKRGLKTIRQIISRYAPASENNTEGYIQQVASICFRSADEEIDITNKDEMVLLVSAMSRVENGRVKRLYLIIFVNRAFQHANIGKITIFFRVIQAVTNYKLVFNDKAGVFGFNGNFTALGFIEQRYDINAGRRAAVEHFLQIIQRITRIDDVFND